MSTLKREATQSIVWSAIERFSVQGIQYVISIIIARLLLPSDYGIIAMLSIFLAVFQTIIDGGFGYALIQKKNPSETDFSTVFYFNIVVSLLLYGLLYGASPFIASFYNIPLLDSVTKVVGLTLIINSLGIIQQTRLTIDLDFKRQAIASLIAVTLGGIAGIVMAYKGYGVWALVWHTLLNNGLRILLLWVFARWRPLMVFSRESFLSLFSFGSKLLLSSVLHTIYTNLYTLVIGKKFAETELGYFNRAATLAQFPSTNFTNIIIRAMYPIQCKMQDDDVALNRMFITYLRMACYVIFPIMVGLCAIAEPLISLLLTDKWLPSAPLFQILCIAYMWDPVMKINHNILNVKGRSDFFLQAELIKKAIALVILLATIPLGITVMCVGLILYSLADIAVIVHFSYKLTQISFKAQLRALTPVILLAFSMGAVVWLSMIPFAGTFTKLMVGTVVGIAYYGGASHLFRFKELDQIISVVRKKG